MNLFEKLNRIEDNSLNESVEKYYAAKYTAVDSDGNKKVKKILFRCDGTIEDAENKVDEIITEPYTAVKVFGSVNKALAVRDGFELVESVATNGITDSLPPRIDTMIQDMAQMTELFTYADVTNHKFTEEEIQVLTNIYRRWRRAAEYMDDEKMEGLAKSVRDILSISLHEGLEGDEWTEYVENGLNYDAWEFMEEMYQGYYQKAYKLVEAEGFTDVITEPSTQMGSGRDFFWAKKDGKRYSGSYDFETLQDEIKDCILVADSEEEAMERCAKKYAEIIIANLQDEDEYEED